MAKKLLFKACPKCKFAKCWSQAKTCENCGYDFKLQRMPRKHKEPVFEDDDIVVAPVQETPKETNKACPDCGHTCFHKAPFCEKCKYNFVTKESARAQEEREKAQEKLNKKLGIETSEVKPIVEETRQQLGYKPLFRDLKPQPWMDMKPGANVSHWAAHFISMLRSVLGKENVYPACVIEYAEYHSQSAPVRAAVPELLKLYQPPTKGISQWQLVKLPNGEIAYRGEILTGTETQSTYRKIVNERGLSLMTVLALVIFA